MSLVEIAYRIAESAHAGQVDKSGAPYIEHPVRVARAVAMGSSDERAHAVALLHDVVEDSSVSSDDLLSAGMPADVVEAVLALSHRPHEPRAEYYARVRANPLALFVKRFDVADNSDPRRLALLPDDVRERLEKKYANARRQLDAN